MAYHFASRVLARTPRNIWDLGDCQTPSATPRRVSVRPQHGWDSNPLGSDAGCWLPAEGPEP